MSKDWIPDADAAFNEFYTAFHNFVVVHGAAKGLSAGEIAACTADFTRWQADYAAHLAAQVAAQAARQSKDTSRKASEPGMRALARRLQTSPDMTDADRTGAGLTVRDEVRTAAAPPMSRPLVRADTAHRLRHTLFFRDEEAPRSKRKPRGVMGVEIWRALGPNPPADPAEWTFVAFQTSTPWVVDYAGADAGKTAHYILRWVSTRGAKGPWSDTASATIGA